MVQSINLISLVRMDRTCCLTCDFRLDNKALGDQSKNDQWSGKHSNSEIPIPTVGYKVHLTGYDWVKVFKTFSTNGDFEYRITNKLDTTIEQAAFHDLDVFQTEVYHRDLKQHTGIKCCQYYMEVSQPNHIGLAIRALVRLEIHRLQIGLSWFKAKTGIIRDAVRAYLVYPTFTLCAIGYIVGWSIFGRAFVEVV